MISRRIIRVKVMQTLYSLHCTEEQSINLAEKELFFNINKTYDLYHLLLQLLVEIRKCAENRIEQNKAKLRPSAEDLNPNTKFVENVTLSKLAENVNLDKYLQTSKLTWINYPDLIKKLYNTLVETEEFKAYMAEPVRSEREDRKLVEFICTNVIAQSEELFQALEEQSIYWNDDVEFVISMIVKTIDKHKSSTSPNAALYPLFKDEEDEEFAKKLFRKSVLEQKENLAVVEKHLRNWDMDRIAYIDVLIMQMAVAEMTNFPMVPIKVTLNEYIDLAYFYSTPKSKNFINGILDKISKELKSEGKISKVGRGLIGENE